VGSQAERKGCRLSVKKKGFLGPRERREGEGEVVKKAEGKQVCHALEKNTEARAFRKGSVCTGTMRNGKGRTERNGFPPGTPLNLGRKEKFESS